MGISTVVAALQTEFKWTVSNNITGVNYNPTSNSGDIRKTYNFGTASANAASGGGDEVFSFQQTISSASSATLDLTAMTNLLQQAAVSIVRIKGVIFRLLSQTDDSTISANSTNVTMENQTPANPAPLFPNGGSGLTLALTTGGGIITSVAIGVAGSGYPKSATFLVTPQQAGGAGGAVFVLTNASGVPITTTLVAGSGGTGYSNATVPTTPTGMVSLAGGSSVLQGSVYCYFDAAAGGFMTGLGAAAKNIKFQNLDGTNSATVEVNVFAATS